VVQSRKKASDVLVCLLPVASKGGAVRLSSEERASLDEVEEFSGFQLLPELKRRSLGLTSGSIHTLSCSGPQAKIKEIVIGVFGKKEDPAHQAAFVRKLSARVQRSLVKVSERTVLLSPLFFAFLSEEQVSVFFEGLLLSDYEFSRYKSDSKKKAPIRIATERADKPSSARLKEIDATVSGVALARDLVNLPAGDLAPRHLVQAAKKISRRANVSTRIFNRAQLTSKKMNGVLSVGRASAEEPAFITMKYEPRRRVSSSAPVVGLVGKGVTFDSGGLSIKTGVGMETMKCDMAGAAVVLGVFEALSHLQIPLKIKGYVPAVENMIQGNALKPGDVIPMMSGKTVEVLNTDAEGRLILADALHYASQDGCDVVIDLATLTGACVVALGDLYCWTLCE
jgi:leucyl aminopeptidase